MTVIANVLYILVEWTGPNSEEREQREEINYETKKGNEFPGKGFRKT